MIAYSRYPPHANVFEQLTRGSLAFVSAEAEALPLTVEVRARRAAGELFLVWEWAPERVLEAWGEPDLVLSNGFFPHYSTVSWDREGWVASAAWPRAPLTPLTAADEGRVRRWIDAYRACLCAQGDPLRHYLPPSDPAYLLVVLQNEDDLVARWWPEGRGSEWLVQQAVEHAARRGLLVRVKQHPYDPKAPSDYDVDPSRVRFLGKDAIPYPDLPKANDALLAGATEVWGFNSTMLTEAALIHGVPTRAFGPTLMDGHGILAQEAPFVPSAADSTPSLGADERRLAFLRRVLARQVSADHVAEAESSIRASQELANRWDVVLARDART